MPEPSDDPRTWIELETVLIARRLVEVEAQRDAARARLAEAEALLRREHAHNWRHGGHPMSPECEVCAFLAAGDSDA